MCLLGWKMFTESTVRWQGCHNLLANNPEEFTLNPDNELQCIVLNGDKRVRNPNIPHLHMLIRQI